MNHLLEKREFSRRSFLRDTSWTLVGMSVAGSVTAGSARAANDPSAVSPAHTGALPGPPDPAQVDSWLQVNPDNSVTLFHGWVEMGQGSPTAMLQIAAEELRLSLDQVSAAQVDSNVSVSAISAGSSSTYTAMTATSLRGAAAAARTLLLNQAATQLGAPVSGLSVSNGVVSGGGRSVTYAALMAGKLFGSTIAAANATLTAPSAYRLIGTRVPRIEIPSIVTGTRTYIQNVRVAGMLHGRVVRPRGQASLVQGATLLSIDKSSIAAFPDVQVVEKGNFVGVVAPREWEAIQAAAELKVQWDETPGLPGSGDLEAALRDPANLYETDLAVDTGNVDSALAGAAHTVSASYFWPYQMHGALGPNCAIADVTQTSATVLGMSQAPYFLTVPPLAAALGLPASAVRIEVFPASGNYGHNTYDDVNISAALLSQAVGKPVRVQYMRWDEHGWDQFGPAQATDARAGIDANGNLVAYDYTAYNHGWTQVLESAAQLAGAPLPPQQPGWAQIDTENSAGFYTVANRRVTLMDLNAYKEFFKGIWLRAPGVPQAIFASEVTIDALAKAANMDPIAFRIQNIDATQTTGVARWIGVLQAAAHAASWQAKVSASDLASGNLVTGRGVAIGGFAGTYPAIIADITVNKTTGQIGVDHLYAAQDAGTAVNPASIENQIEGCLVQGVSRALLEEVAFTRTRQTSLDWVTYPVVRFRQSPNVTAVVVQQLELPSSGSGEPTTAPVAAAIANAFYDATGVRLTRVPMTPAYVRAALKAAA